MRIGALAAAVRNVPSWVYRHLGLGAIVPFAALTVVASVLVSHLAFKPAIEELIPPGDHYYADQTTFAARFAEPSYATVLVRSDPLFSARSLNALSTLQDVLQSRPEIKSVLSAVSLRDLSQEGGEISFVPLYSTKSDRSEAAASGDSASRAYEYDAQSIGALKERVLDTPLFRKFLLSKDMRSFTLYVFPEKRADSDTVAREVLAAASKVEGTGLSVLAFGTPISMYYSKQAGIHDLLLLGAISLLVAFLLEGLFARSAVVGSILLVCSLVPALWTLAVFPIFGVAMTVYTVVVPLMVIALSTSYGIHLFRHYSTSRENDMSEVLRGVAPIITVAGLTTMLGFASLLLTPIVLLRTLGLLVIPGIFFSMVTAVFLLPPLIARAHPRLDPAHRWSPIWERRRFDGRHARLILVLFGVLVLFLVVGVMFVQSDFRTERGFRSHTAFGMLARNYARRNGGLDELIVAIDTGKEYGLVDSKTYAGVRSIEKTVQDFGDNSTVISFTDFVDWMESRLSAQGTSAPQGDGTPDPTRIGEDLELLFSADTGLRIDSLVDPSYRRTRLIVHFGVSSDRVSKARASFVELRRSIARTAKATLPAGTSVRFFGGAQSFEHQQGYLVRSQLYSCAFFFAALLVVLLVSFRSIRWSVLVLLPPLSGLLFFFGLLGWLGISFSPFTVFMVSAVMGVGNDDVLFFVLNLRGRMGKEPLVPALSDTLFRTGSAIIQTTVVVAVALCVLWFSEFSYVSSQGVLGAATLCACTAITYWVVPAVLHSTGKSWTIRTKKERQ